MTKSTLHGVSRREFLTGTSMLGATTLLGLPRIAGAEPPPETTKIRVVQSDSICLAPQYVAEELFRLDGFAEVEYVKYPGGQASSVLAAGRADFTMTLGIRLRSRTWFADLASRRIRRVCALQRPALKKATYRLKQLGS